MGEDIFFSWETVWRETFLPLTATVILPSPTGQIGPILREKILSEGIFVLLELQKQQN